LTAVGAQTPVSWILGSAPSWLSLTDNGNGTATLFGTPPAGTTGTVTAQIAAVALGSLSVNFPNSQPVFTSYPVTVINEPALLSPRIATFTVGSQSSFTISATEGDVGIFGALPQGLSFTGGNPATIEGTPAVGSGGQYHVNVGVSLGSKVHIYGSLTLNVDEAPSFISRNSGIIPAGLPGSFTVSTAGFPSVSATPLSLPLTPPSNPNQGKGMFFTVTGLPSTLQASNLNPDGFATGTLNITGSPSPNDVGPHFVQITAQNGVGEIARQFLTLQVVQVGRTPASGTACSGAYNGIFRGNIEVSQGQNCLFVGGGVDGNVTVIGGDFTLSNAVVTGQVDIQGFSQLTIGPKSTINGHLGIINVTGEAPSKICGSVVEGGLFVEDNAIPIDIGSSDGSCAGNVIGGALVIQGNAAQINVFGNQIVGHLLCQNGPLIDGGGNTAHAKTGNCVGF
jgi:Putative Ig domain